jgi:hypothetical protein
MCMQRHSTFISLVAVLKFLANGDRYQKVANAVLAYLRAFSYMRVDFLRSRTGPKFSRKMKFAVVTQLQLIPS